MTEVKAYPPGTFCWVELATTDVAAAKKFYASLFDWTATDNPIGEGGVYTMFQKGGKNICAQYAMAPDMIAQGIPPHWRSYVSVENVDASAEKVGTLGGTVMMAPFDVMEVGRMAVVQDSGGATFALWQPNQHIGAELVNEPGTLCWNELRTKDVAGAKQFYEGLFGWTTTSSPSGSGFDYLTFHNGDRMAGGMMQIQADWGDVPPHWSAYFAVEDCDATVAKAQELGGKLGKEPMDAPEVGRFASLQDPNGTFFEVIHLTGNVN